MNHRHITRFTYTFTNFQGWRVAIRRNGYTLTRYFSDRQYKESEAAFEQAVSFRDTVLNELEQNPGNELAVLSRYRNETRTEYPAGLKPAAAQKNEETNSCACSVRSNKVMQGILKKVCSRLKLDTASVLKLSLYLFSMQYGFAGTAPRNINLPAACLKSPMMPGNDGFSEEPDLYQLIAELNRAGKDVGLPSFEEFSTGKIGMIAALEDAPNAFLPIHGEFAEEYVATSAFTTESFHTHEA